MHETDSIVALASGKRLKDWVSQASEPCWRKSRAHRGPQAARFSLLGVEQPRDLLLIVCRCTSCKSCTCGKVTCSPSKRMKQKRERTSCTSHGGFFRCGARELPNAFRTRNRNREIAVKGPRNELDELE